MLTLSFLLEGARGARLGREEQLVLAHATALGLDVAYASIGQLQSRRVRLAAGQVPVGGIQFVNAALQQQGLPVPAPDCYPSALRPYLLRRMERVLLHTVRSRLERGGPPRFIKPVDRLKRFTGFVLDDPSDYRLAGVSHALMVWDVEPVVWRSEWRAYVVDNQVAHLAFSAGAREARPDDAVLQAMAQAYAGCGAPAGYILDVGVLNSGATSLVEVNDGFSVGAYAEVPAAAYAGLLARRWAELSAQSA
jgi:hypothetical protein